jgi:hypothetical protein
MIYLPKQAAPLLIMGAHGETPQKEFCGTGDRKNMFDDDFYRSAKWFVALFDIAIIAFLSSRLVETVATLIDGGDVELFGSFTVAHFWSIALVVFAFGCLFLYWLNRLNLEAHEIADGAPVQASVKQMGLVFAIAAIAVVGMELTVTYKAFSLANSDPYAVSDPSTIDMMLNFLFACLAVGVHVISAYLSAKTYLALKPPVASSSTPYVPPSAREPK